MESPMATQVRGRWVKAVRARVLQRVNRQMNFFIVDELTGSRLKIRKKAMPVR